MKNIKRILALTIVAMMLVAIAIIPVSADEARRVPACDCGGFFAVTKTTYGGWVTTSTRNCTHYANGRDEEQRRAVKKTYTCDECGDSYTSTTYQYRTNCVGYN